MLLSIDICFQHLTPGLGVEETEDTKELELELDEVEVEFDDESQKLKAEEREHEPRCKDSEELARDGKAYILRLPQEILSLIAGDDLLSTEDQFNIAQTSAYFRQSCHHVLFKNVTLNHRSLVLVEMFGEMARYTRLVIDTPSSVGEVECGK